MKEYIGTKVIQAEPAVKVTVYHGDCVVADQVMTADQFEDAKAKGWEFRDQKDGYKVVYKGGYESWSPKDVFEAAYRETADMTNIDRILAGDKETLINEIHDIVQWARGLNPQEWHNITHDADGGLHGVIRRIVEGQVK